MILRVGYLRFSVAAAVRAPKQMDTLRLVMSKAESRGDLLRRTWLFHF
jgi:hypothetical protein